MTAKRPPIYDSDPPVLAIAAVANALVSPDEDNANGEPANVADGLFAIARAIDRLADILADETGSLPAIARAAEALARAAENAEHRASLS
jgi:hypothetical protein